MKTNFPDLNAADRNWIQFNGPGDWHNMCGPLANDLLECSEFELTAFPYQVWEVVGYRSNSNPVAILRANQSTLKGALNYMSQGRVLVYNRQADKMLTAKLRRQARDSAMRDCGLVKVRGAMGGTYWE